MHPVLLDFGRFKLHSYGLMMFLAFAIGTWVATVRARKAGIKSTDIMDLTVWILLSSILGARIAYVLFHIDEFQGRWLDVINPFQSDGTIGIAGLVVLGGVIAAVPAATIFLKKRNLPVLKVLDVMIVPLALGMVIGRIGCLLNGCCFGLPTEVPWGMVFPPDCYAGSVYPHQHIHPTQLYAIIYNLLIAIILTLRTPKKKFEGELFYLFFLVYGPFRFINETVRYYRSSMVAFSIGEFSVTVSMIISIMITISALLLLINGYRSLREAK